MKRLWLSLALFLLPLYSSSFVIDRVILSTDTHADYIEFWPVVARVWSSMGIRPTLALIATPDVVIDETIGDVIRFEPIPGVPNGLYAQVIRLLLPIYFEEDVCLISDIDMIPLDKDYFIQGAARVPEHAFLMYRELPAHWRRVQMCYNAAKGKLFKEIFRINSPAEIPARVAAWHNLDYGFYTDEKVFFLYLVQWPGYRTRCAQLRDGTIRRLDRTEWKYTLNQFKNGAFIDMHCPRPYSKHKAEIDMLLQLAQLPYA